MINIKPNWPKSIVNPGAQTRSCSK